MSAESYLQMMIDSLTKKIDLLKSIANFNEEQEKLLDSLPFDEDAFEKNMYGKGDCIDELNHLDEGFQALFDRVSEELKADKSKYTSEIARLQDMIREITALGATIETQESRNKVKVENRFRIMKSEVKQAKRSTSMANTYYQSMSRVDTAPQFFDNKK